MDHTVWFTTIPKGQCWQGYKTLWFAFVCLQSVSPKNTCLTKRNLCSSVRVRPDMSSKWMTRSLVGCPEAYLDPEVEVSNQGRNIPSQNDIQMNHSTTGTSYFKGLGCWCSWNCQEDLLTVTLGNSGQQWLILCVCALGSLAWPCLRLSSTSRIEKKLL